jgi:hypothetical protein
MAHDEPAPLREDCDFNCKTFQPPFPIERGIVLRNWELSFGAEPAHVALARVFQSGTLLTILFDTLRLPIDVRNGQRPEGH